MFLKLEKQHDRKLSIFQGKNIILKDSESIKHIPKNVKNKKYL